MGKKNFIRNSLQSPAPSGGGKKLIRKLIGRDGRRNQASFGATGQLRRVGICDNLFCENAGGKSVAGGPATNLCV